MRLSALLVLLLLTGCAPGNRAEWRERLDLEARAMVGTAGSERVVLAADGVLLSIDAATGDRIAETTLAEFEPNRLESIGTQTLAFSGQGREVVWWTGDRFERLYRTEADQVNAASEEREVAIPGPDYPPGPSRFSGAGVLSDGTLTICDNRGRAGLWRSGELTTSVNSSGRIAGSAVSPDGQTLVIVDPEKLHFFQLPQAEKGGEFLHRGRLKGLAFSPDSAHLAAVMADRIEVVDTLTLSVTANLPGVASSVTFSADGRYLCATNVGTVDVWDLEKRSARGSVTVLSVVQSELIGEVPHLVTRRTQGVDLWSLDRPEQPIWSYHKPIRLLQPKPDGIWLYTASGWLESWRLPLSAPQ